MSWDQKKSTERVQTDLDNLPEIEVKKLEREADLENLLSATNCREIYGAHAYLDVANFSFITALGENEDSLKSFVKAVHIYQRQLAWIVEIVFDGIRVHFQGSRLHVLFYRPIGDGKTLATRTVLAMLVVRDFLRYVFNPSFPAFTNLAVRAGADIGTVIGTQNGMRGDRELLFIGSPANDAAKILDSGLRLTSRVYNNLPKELQERCELVDETAKIYRVATVGKDDLDALLKDNGITWNRKEAEDRVASDVKAFPLKDIAFVSANEPIDFDTLSIYTNKHILSASLFADVTGFTHYVASATTDEAKEEALAAFHVIRSEFTRVATHDMNAVRVQFQGDRMQALVHLPKGDGKAIAQKATDLAIWLQSAMEMVVRKVVPGTTGLHIAVGVDMGEVVATRLGQRGHRDRIVLGTSVLAAAANEERTTAKQVGISKLIYEQLSDDLREYFSWSPTAKCYVAADLTVTTLERKKEAAKYANVGAAVNVSSSGSTFRVTREEVPRGTTVVPSRSYSE
jgi:class 3 adenylate cyclase